MKLLCIDPSIRALGWAVFKIVTASTARLVDSGCIRLGKEWRGKDVDWMARMDHMVDCVGDLMLRRLNLGDPYSYEVLIELPEHFGAGAGVRVSGRAAAAQNSDAVLKLFGFVMVLRAMVRGAGADVTLVKVSTWKGQMPKKVTAARVQRRWGWEGIDDNESDAVGLGDWLLYRERGLKPIR